MQYNIDLRVQCGIRLSEYNPIIIKLREYSPIIVKLSECNTITIKLSDCSTMTIKFSDCSTITIKLNECNTQYRCETGKDSTLVVRIKTPTGWKFVNLAKTQSNGRHTSADIGGCEIILKIMCMHCGAL